MLNIYLLAIYALIAYVLYMVFNPLFIGFDYKLKYKEKIVLKFWPLLGTFWYIFTGIHKGDSQKWVRQIIKENPKAKIIFTNFCFQPEMMIIDPSYAREMFSVHTHKYQWTDLLFASEYFMDQGLVATLGKKWKQQRSMLGNVFHFDALKKRIPVISEIALEKIADLKKRGYDKGDKNLAVLSEAQTMTGEVIVRSFFGKKFSKQSFEGMDINETITSFVYDCASVSMDPYFSLKRILLGKKIASKFMLSSKERRAQKKVIMLRNLAFSLIEERIENFDENKENKDFLDFYLIEFFKNNDDKDNKITKEEIVQQFITFYFAGMDTTANLFGKALYMVAQYKDVYKQVQKEIDEIITDINDIKGEDLNKMTVTTAFLKEILRYAPPAYILGFRTVKQAFNLCNEMDIPKGMTMDISIHGITRDGKSFENPDKFDINRFMPRGPDISNPAYLPFGSGARNCIGQHLAMFEAKVFLIHFMKNFELEFDESKLPLKMGGILLYQPQDQNLIKLKNRKQQ